MAASLTQRTAAFLKERGRRLPCFSACCNSVNPVLFTTGWGQTVGKRGTGAAGFCWLRLFDIALSALKSQLLATKCDSNLPCRRGSRNKLWTNLCVPKQLFGIEYQFHHFFFSESPIPSLYMLNKLLNHIWYLSSFGLQPVSMEIVQSGINVFVCYVSLDTLYIFLQPVSTAFFQVRSLFM